MQELDMLVNDTLDELNDNHRGNLMQRYFLGSLLALASWALTASAEGESKVKPLSLPPGVRVQSSGPRGLVWERLSPKEKMLTYHLVQAANAGRDLLFY